MSGQISILLLLLLLLLHFGKKSFFIQQCRNLKRRSGKKKKRQVYQHLKNVIAWIFARGCNLFPLFFYFHDTLNWNIERGCIKGEKKRTIDKEEKKGRVKERLAGRQTEEGGSSSTCVWFTAVGYNLPDQREIQLFFQIDTLKQDYIGWGLVLISDYRYQTKEVIAFQHTKRMAAPFRDQRRENSDVWDLFCLRWNILLDNLFFLNLHSNQYCQHALSL